MQNAALLWQVSLLVPSGQKGLALGIVGLVKVVPIVVFSMIGGRRGRCVEPPAADAVHADRVGARDAVGLPGPDARRGVERVAHLRPCGAGRRRRAPSTCRLVTR